MRPHALVLALLSAAVAAPAVAGAPAGVWANPSNSVHVTFKRCGDDVMCGRVVWANARAKADAERGSGERLVGTEMFRDFVEEAPGEWHGEVYIPDIDKTLSGTITRIDSRTLRGEGCLFGSLGCQSQTWKRVK